MFYKKIPNFYYTYLITNKILNKSYVGSRICYKKDPKNDGYMGSSKYLDEDYITYGIENFSKEIIKSDYANVKDMLKGESYYIHKYNTFEPNGYNRYDPGKNPGWHSGGISLSNDRKQIISLIWKNKKQSAEHIEKRVSQLRGKKLSENTKNKLRELNTGKIQSKETKEKRSKKLKGRIVSNETKEKLSKSLIGNKNSLGKICSEEKKEKIRQKKIGNTLSEESRKKISKSLKGNIPWNKGKKKTTKNLIYAKNNSIYSVISNRFFRTKRQQNIFRTY
jgi:hypothetical protein